jgi:hypothetical protein
MTLDLNARYKVDGYEGVAFWLKGHPQTQDECQGHPAEDHYNPDPHAGIGEVFYCDGSCAEPHDDEQFAIAIMVGDDRPHVIDVDDLTVIGDLDYCHVCGQIGCGHDGLDRG